MRMTPRNVADCAVHPRWSFSVLLRYLATTGMPRFSNLPADAEQTLRKAKQVIFPKSQTVTWDAIGQLRRMWGGPLLIKGILHPDDARLALSSGADAIIVSNHGGRTLDSAVPPLVVLERVMDRVGDKMPVLIDSGFRRGTHIVKALALGAKAVLMGRAPLYGLAAGGLDGVRHALSMLRAEIDRTVAQVGCRTIADLGPDLIYRADRQADSSGNG
jgi:isopentenyl diphosphate isomerase/L-lactate dehydrogenase-like FMN-dependent dehydrogenase